MSLIKNISAGLVCLLMLYSPQLASAQNQALPVQPAAASAFTPFFMYDSAPSDPLPWWQSHTLIDASGGMHVAFDTPNSVIYAYCAVDCGKDASWTGLVVSPPGPFASLAHPTLALNPQGHPRLMWFYDNTDFVYGECDADCTSSSSNWQLVHVTVTDIGYAYPKDNGYFAMDHQGRPRLALSDPNGFQYVTCNLECTTASHWTINHIALFDNYDSIDALKLVFNASNQPRAVGSLNNDKLAYLECNGDCTQVSGWSQIALDTVGDYYNDYGFSLRLDGSGHPRIAYYKAGSDDTLYYKWSDANSTALSGWQTASLTGYAPYGYSRSIDLAIDSQGLPRVAFATKDGDLAYATCTSACKTTAPTWQLQIIEKRSALDAAFPSVMPPQCNAQAWDIEGYTSLALDTADHPSITYFVRHTEMCLNSQGKYVTFTDRSGIRFAALGSTTGGPQHFLYLPAISKH